MNNYTVTVTIEFDIEAMDEEGARLAAIAEVKTGAVREVEVTEVIY